MVVVVGLPLSLDGTRGRAAAEAAEAEAEALGALLGDHHVEVELFDERLTTVTAHQALAAGGTRSRQRRAVVDQTAAAVMLVGLARRVGPATVTMTGAGGPARAVPLDRRRACRRCPRPSPGRRADPTAGRAATGRPHRRWRIGGAWPWWGWSVVVLVAGFLWVQHEANPVRAPRGPGHRHRPVRHRGRSAGRRRSRPRG